jgi:thiosulfate dehydrogenase
MANGRGTGGGGRVLLGFVLGVVVVILGVAAYVRWGPLPVAAADKPFPFEQAIVDLPLDARIKSEMKQPPFGVSEDVYEAGAKIYREQCASCHGTPGHDIAFADQMYPEATALWKPHGRRGVVGVSDDEAGETYWKVANGIRLTGMPSFDHILNDTQMWQVSLLVKNADQKLPEPVMRTLTAP